MVVDVAYYTSIGKVGPPTETDVILLIIAILNLTTEVIRLANGHSEVLRLLLRLVE